MLDVKYLAWDKDTKKVYSVPSLNFMDHTVDIMIGFDSSNSPKIRTVLADSVILMKDTGLKDFYDTPIFEGDTAVDLSNEPVGFILTEQGNTYLKDGSKKILLSEVHKNLYVNGCIHKETM